jgi:hypothetical protein
MWLLTGIKETGEKLFSGLDDKRQHTLIRSQQQRRSFMVKVSTAPATVKSHLLQRKIQAVSNKNLALLMLSFFQRCNNNKILNLAKCRHQGPGKDGLMKIIFEENNLTALSL